jgi:hypothetical protein
VSQSGTAIDVSASTVVKAGDEATRPSGLIPADPRGFDGSQVADGETKPFTVEATENLDEVVEMDAVPLRATERPSRRQ